MTKKPPSDIITELEQLLQVIKISVCTALQLTPLLQLDVTTYTDNDTAGETQALQKLGHPVKSICAQLNGREGHLCGNLMGKQVDFSVHTVITGDPNLELEEVGVPKTITMNLTYQEQGEYVYIVLVTVPADFLYSHTV